MIDAKTIKKYESYTTAELRKKAASKFRKWVRERDKGEPCISCGSWNTSDASHLYSAGHYPELEMEPDNCHLACRRCNFFLSGNLQEYRKRLIIKIGIERVERLDRIADQHKRTGYKHDRISLIEKLEQYK
jgi:hypothetical protein